MVLEAAVWIIMLVLALTRAGSAGGEADCVRVTGTWGSIAPELEPGSAVH